MDPQIGPVAYVEAKDSELVLDKPYSEATAKLIDRQVRQLVAEAYSRTEALLTEKRGQLEKIAKLLLDKEVIQKENMIELLGPRPFEEKPEQTKPEQQKPQGEEPQPAFT
jgi:AFG3 family protein